MAFNPVLLSAMSEVEPKDAGLASGVVNTSLMMGGALGLAVLASLAALAHRRPRRQRPPEQVAALNSGYQVAFLIGVIFAVVAAVMGGTLLRSTAMQPHGEPAAAAESSL